MQMFDLMLQNSCIPTRRLNRPCLRVLIETIHPHTAVTRYQRHVTRQAQATFEVFDLGLTDRRNRRVDKNMERHWFPFALGELFGSQIPAVFRQVFNNRQLNAFSNLWSGETDSRSVAQRLVHELDKLLDFGPLNFVPREFAGWAAKDRFSELH